MLDSSPKKTVNGSPAKRLASKIKLYADLQIEVDQAALTVHAENDHIIVIPARLSDLRALWNKFFKPLIRSKDTFTVLERALNRMGITICIYHRFAGILGPEANPFLRRCTVRLLASRPEHLI